MILEPGMGFEPTSAIFYTAGCGNASAARRLNRSAFGDPTWCAPAWDQPRQSPRRPQVSRGDIISLMISQTVAWWKWLEAKSQLFFKLCSDHLAIEAIPRTKFTLNFSRIREILEANYTCILWSQYFVVLRSREGEEITLRKDGRMIIRNAKTEQDAHSVANGLLKLLKN